MTAAPAAAAPRADIAGHSYAIRETAPADMAAVLGLFRRVFGRDAAPAWFDWKYGHGGGEAIGVWDDGGRLVAHYAGFPRTLLWAGKPLRGIQIGDVMVLPEVRGILTRRGPFFQACHRFFSTRVGADRPHDLAFGFPNERHARLGTTLSLYRDCGPMLALSWPAAAATWSLGWSWTALDPGDPNFDRHAAAAWTAMRPPLADMVVGQRDAAYLRWRFVERPDRHYRFFRLKRRWPAGPSGIAVLRIEDGAVEWLDWIGPPAMLAPALDAARAEAARHGAEMLTAWASPAVAEVLNEAATATATAATAARLAVACASVHPHEVAPRHWWCMGGDTEFL